MSGEMPTKGAPSRGRAGRPRDPSVEKKLLEAARSELAERGVVGFSMRGVAERSGVARSSLLLRWPDQDALILDAIDSLRLDVVPQLKGDLRDDLALLLGVVAEQMGPERMDLLMRVMGDARKSPGLLTKYQERLLSPVARLFDEVLRDAEARGELPEGVDRRLLADGLLGIIYIRTMASPDRQPPGEAARRSVIERLIRQFGAPATVA